MPATAEPAPPAQIPSFVVARSGSPAAAGAPPSGASEIAFGTLWGTIGTPFVSSANPKVELPSVTSSGCRLLDPPPSAPAGGWLSSATTELAPPASAQRLALDTASMASSVATGASPPDETEVASHRMQGAGRCLLRPLFLLIGNEILVQSINAYAPSGKAIAMKLILPPSPQTVEKSESLRLRIIAVRPLNLAAAMVANEDQTFGLRGRPCTRCRHGD